MEKHNWKSSMPVVNGQFIRVLPEAEFRAKELKKTVDSRIASLVHPIRRNSRAIERLAKEISKTNLAFARLMAGRHRWAPRYRFRSWVEKRHSRIRCKQRPTRLQRRRQRQTKNRVKL